MGLADWLFPKRCVACRKLGFYFCSKCRQKIKIIENQVCPVCERPSIGGLTHPRCQTRYSLDGLTSFFVYEGPIKQAIKELKYRFVTGLSSELVSLIDTTSMYRYIRVLKTGDDILTPIPLHWWRKNWRGFNQAEILGKMIAENLRIKFIPNLLIRKKFTQPQVELEGKKRQENIKNAFSVSSKIHHLPSNILLFDDIWTTGATLRTCGAVLKRAGVKRVWGVTLAR